MKRLIFILFFPLSLMAQDTIQVVGQKLGSSSGEWKQFIITTNSASIVQGTGTVILPSGGGSTDSSIFATVYQLGLKANLAEMNNALGGKAATSHGHAISEVTNLQTNLDAKLATTAVKQGAYLSDTTKFPLTNSLRQGAYLSDTTKFPLTSALKQGAYLSDTTKFALTSHTQVQSTITGLTDSVAAKPTRTEFTTQLATKAASTHGHAQSEVTALTDSIAAKPTRGELTTQLATKANTSHTQAISTVTALQDSLTTKLNRSEYTLGGNPTKQTILDSLNAANPSLAALTRQYRFSNSANDFFGDSVNATTLIGNKLYMSGYLVYDQDMILSAAQISNLSTGYPFFDANGAIYLGALSETVRIDSSRIVGNYLRFSANGGIPYYARKDTTLTASQGQEVWTVTDLTTYATTSGTGTQAILSTITTPATNQVLAWNGTNWVNQNDATGSGLPNYVSVKRTADTSTSLATPLQIGGMAFSVTSGVYYSYRYVLLYQTGATTTGIKLALTFPAVTTQSAIVTISGQTTDGATTEPWCGTINSSGDVVTSTGVAVINVNYVATIEGNILPSATGYLVLQWASETTAAATLKQGSIGYLWSF